MTSGALFALLVIREGSCCEAPLQPLAPMAAGSTVAPLNRIALHGGRGFVPPVKLALRRRCFVRVRCVCVLIRKMRKPERMKLVLMNKEEGTEHFKNGLCDSTAALCFAAPTRFRSVLALVCDTQSRAHRRTHAHARAHTHTRPL